MDSPITFTMTELQFLIRSLCELIVSLGAAGGVIIAVVHFIRKPKEKADKAIESRFEYIEDKLKYHKSAIETMAEQYGDLINHFHLTAKAHDDAILALHEGLTLLIETQRASIDFKLNDGSDKEKLKKMDEKIDQYLQKSASRPFTNMDADKGWSDINETFIKNIKKSMEE